MFHHGKIRSNHKLSAFLFLSCNFLKFLRFLFRKDITEGYYTKGLHCFDRTKQGYCREQDKIVNNQVVL